MGYPLLVAAISPLLACSGGSSYKPWKATKTRDYELIVGRCRVIGCRGERASAQAGFVLPSDALRWSERPDHTRQSLRVRAKEREMGCCACVSVHRCRRLFLHMQKPAQGDEMKRKKIGHGRRRHQLFRSLWQGWKGGMACCSAWLAPPGGVRENCYWLGRFSKDFGFDWGRFSHSVRNV